MKQIFISIATHPKIKDAVYQASPGLILIAGGIIVSFAIAIANV